jgi:drug/metabolite transporter (DMT)-like permease
MGIILVLLGIPLMLRWVPRNYIYGYRLPSALVSDDAWYRANVVQGKALIFTGLVSMPLDILAVQFFDRRTAASLAVAILCAAVLVSFLSTWLILFRERHRVRTG